MKPVPRIGRLLDLLGLVVFLAGGGLAARAWLGFREVEGFERSPDDATWAAVEMANGFWRLQKIGVGLMLVGVAVFFVAWWVARQKSA